jgi:tRNA(Ile)-lysidine synthase
MKAAVDCERQLKDNILQQGVIPYAARILVGVSGGADSTALLHLLHSLRYELALDLIVVHYDHALRPGSGKDLRFVGEMSADLGLTFLSEKNRVKCPKGSSVEDFARGRRFDFFVRMAKKTGADAVVLAHTQDDLAETVLMRILRGTGLSGLRSILPQRRISGIVFLRPMLDMTRVQVESFLVGKKIKYVDDPTNAGDDFLRNRIRHKLIPYITKEFSVSVKEKLAELAFNASIDYDFIETSLQKALDRTLTTAPHAVKITLKTWKSYPQAIRRMVLREAVERMTGVQGGLSYQHALLLEKTALKGKKSRISLPLGFEAVISDKFLTLS